MFYNGGNYDRHFRTKELAEELKDQFECPGENTEKYKNFPVPVKIIWKW